jgi:hypothetical protein
VAAGEWSVAAQLLASIDRVIYGSGNSHETRCRLPGARSFVNAVGQLLTPGSMDCSQSVVHIADKATEPPVKFLFAIPEIELKHGLHRANSSAVRSIFIGPVVFVKRH